MLIRYTAVMIFVPMPQQITKLGRPLPSMGQPTMPLIHLRKSLVMLQTRDTVVAPDC